jgi:hypothetical protein
MRLFNNLPSVFGSNVSAWLISESELWEDNVVLSSSNCGVGVSYPVIDDDDDVSPAIAVWYEAVDGDKHRSFTLA